MAASAALLSGEDGLSAEQRVLAARHLLRHYKQPDVNLQPPQVLIDLAGTQGESYLSRIATGTLSGEMSSQEIRVAAGIDVAALKAGDDDPMEVVVEIPAGISSRGWVYGKKVIRGLVGQMRERMVAGYLGHQRQENLEYEFPVPVTHWIGAEYRDGSAFIRGVVDKAATDLKRWIRAGAVSQVSIYGYMQTEDQEGVTHVTDVDLLSVDWVPLDRAGMQTRIVAVGEQKQDVGRAERKPEMATLAEVLGELRKLKATPSQVAGEMGWKVEDVVADLGYKPEIEADALQTLKDQASLVGECAKALGLESAAGLVDAAKDAKAAQDKLIVAEHAAMVDEVLAEKIVAETARPLVQRMLHLEIGMSKEDIEKAVGELMATDEIKQVLSSAFGTPSITSTDASRDESGSLAYKKVRF